MRTLGVDPGVQGAAVLLGRRGSLDVAWAWVRRQRAGALVYRLVSALASYPEAAALVEVRTLSEVGSSIAADLGKMGFTSTVLVVEDAYSGKSPRSSIQTARYQGALVGPLERVASGWNANYVTSSQWRRVVMPQGWQARGKAGGLDKRRAAKLYAIESARLASDRFDPVVEALASRLARAQSGRAGDVAGQIRDGCADAYGIARAGRVLVTK